MNMKRTMTMLVLITALLVTATWACADLPAQEANIWAPTGDVVGKTNHGTLTLQMLDATWYAPWDADQVLPKVIEDWQQDQKFASTFIFGMNAISEKGNLIFLRSAVDNRLGALIAGHVTLGNTLPGKRGFTFDYRGFNHRYDTTTELRTADFTTAQVPPAMAEVPSLDWNRSRFTMKYHVNQAFHVDGGFSQMNRNGTKGSFLRKFTGGTPPAVKSFDSETNQFWVRANYNRAAFATSLRFNLLSAEGARSLADDHFFGDDQLIWSTRLDASYNVSTKTQVLGGGSYSHLANSQTEEFAGNTYLPGSQANTTAGQLGLVTQVGSSTTFQLNGQLKKQDTDGQLYNNDITVAQAMVRDRTSNIFQAKVVTTGLKNARVQLHYKYKFSDLDQTVALGELPGDAGDYQATIQERTKQDAGLKFRYRFNRKASLKGSLVWNKTKVTETTTAQGAGVDWLYQMGNRDVELLKWELAASLQPAKGFKFDLGTQAIDQTYTLIDSGNAETNWTSWRGFAVANWMATPRLTFLASASLGTEKYELTAGPTATGSVRPLAYDGTTLRFAPGLVFQASDKVNLEAIYEGVRFEDKGDGSNTLNSDCDRLLFRAGYDVSEKARVSLAFNQQKFEESLWDDYTMSVYSVSVSGKF